MRMQRTIQRTVCNNNTLALGKRVSEKRKVCSPVQSEPHGQSKKENISPSNSEQNTPNYAQQFGDSNKR
eukprot:2351337-Amphidinium_carterae.2